MPRHRKDITPEELAAFQARTKEKNKISQARASKKYAQTEPAKAYKKARAFLCHDCRATKKHILKVHQTGKHAIRMRTPLLLVSTALAEDLLQR